MKILKLHWAASKPNFGDWLSPEICGWLSGRKIELTKISNCGLVAVGSLLQRKKERLTLHSMNVWGTGFIAEEKSRRSRHVYHAVRGKLSARLIANKDIAVLGDPGLLADQLLLSHQKATEKKYQLGIIPHYKDKKSELLTNIDIPNSRIIDVYDKPLDVIKKISECQAVISSSLHGLVVADSLGIPNQWMQLGDQIRGGGWKFHDYYSALNVGDVCPWNLLERQITLGSVHELIENYSRTGLDSIKEGLVKSFPFPSS